MPGVMPGIGVETSPYAENATDFQLVLDGKN
jgi:hypothetical protein